MAANPPPPHRRKPGTVGRFNEGELAVRDYAGNVAPMGEVGEIFIRGNSVTPGYLFDDGRVHQGLQRGWLPTGDLGSVDADGFLTVRGRLKEIINRGGEKISPIEVENAMSSILTSERRPRSAFPIPGWAKTSPWRWSSRRARPQLRLSFALSCVNICQRSRRLRASTSSTPCRRAPRQGLEERPA